MKTDFISLDLKGFGWRELKEISKLLQALAVDKPKEFSEEGLTIGFNKNSGFVFLSNEDYQVLLFNGGRLEMFYTCLECGHEGFADEGFESYAEECLCDDCYKEKQEELEE